MKKIILAFMAVAFGFASATYAQTTSIDISDRGVGLENLIVVKEDASAVGAGYSRYRVFVDLADGYGISLVTGTPTVGEMYFRSTGTNGFYNTPIYGTLLGASFPEVYYTIDANIAFDSYVTIGYMGSDRLAVRNAQGYVLNAGGAPTVAQAGMSGANAFTNPDDFSSGTTGATFNPDGGSFPAGFSNAAYGNEILVAQLTCDGDIEFQFAVGVKDAGQNQTISAPISYSTVNAAPTVTLDALASTSFFEGETVSGSAVASDPDGSVAQVEFFIDGVSVIVDNAAPYEFSAPVGAVGVHAITAVVTDNMGSVVNSTNSLTYTVGTNATPVATVTAPTPGTSIDITTGAQTVALTATASDLELDAIAGVEFFVNGSSVGTAAVAPYEVSYTFSVAGTYSITAQASDGSRQGPVSAPVSVTVVNNAEFYYLGVQPDATGAAVKTVPCYEGDQFCVSIMTAQAMNSLTGFDIVMKFDASKVTPTGHVALIDSVLTTSYLNADFEMNVKGDSLFLSIFLDGSVDETDVWTGEGTIACVYFAKNATFGQNETVEFSITKFRESLLNPIDVGGNDVYYFDQEVASINTFTFETFLDPIFNAYVAFWSDMSPVPGQANDASYNSTFLRDGVGSTFGNEADENGMVAYDWVTNGSTNLRVDKYVANKVFDGDTILSLIGGQDALITARFLVDYYELNGWYPNAYQVMAMDVNLDGKVTAGDLTEINKRAVQAIQEFAPGVDWLSTRLSGMNAPQYQPSAAFPLDAGAGRGYSKERVPKRSVLSLDIAEDSCQFLDNETFVMILLGDVDGSFKDIVHTASTSALKSAANNSVIFDLASASYEENFVDVPVRVTGDGINAVDFALMVNTEKLQFMSVTNLQNVEALSNSISQNVWNTSYSLEGYDTEEPVFSVRFMSNGEFSNSDFTYASAFINGEKVDVSFTKAVENVTAVELNEVNVNIYPNPASNMFYVEVSTGASIELIDMNGRVLRKLETIVDRTEISTEGLTSGVYIVRVANEDALTVKRVIVE